MMRPMPSRRQRKPSFSTAYPADQAKPQPRRTLQFVAIAVFLFLGLLFFASPSVPVVQDLRLFHHTPTHKPPVQKNSTSGDVHWFSDWAWLNPFSASITLDEDRSVLPPLKPRPPIYAFYDAPAEKEEKTKVAENKLLLLWRRAWWAQGFRPVILGRSEAMNNPLYELLQAQKLQPQLEADLVRWLAWGQMGTGILANWLVLPMGPSDDHLLTHLRRGEYPKLTRYEGLGTGLFSGEKGAINAAIKDALQSPDLKTSESLLDVVKRDSIAIDTNPSALAFYNADTNAERYKVITALLAENKAEGLLSLAQLITSHLHLTFLNTYPDGFSVLTPYPEKAEILTETAHALASALRTCPWSPIPSSCPPNKPSCTPCSSISPPLLKTPEHYSNTSTTYTIGTIPHPYTLASLLAQSPIITTRHIRRETARDRWLSAITARTLGADIGGPARIVSFKDTVASDWGRARGFWMTEDPDTPELKDVEYHFGFALPALNTTTTADTLPPPSTHNLQPPPLRSQKAVAQALQHQKRLLVSATRHIFSSSTPSTGTNLKQEQNKNGKKNQMRKMRKIKMKQRGRPQQLGSATGVREMVEAWNLADTEAWRFVRAFRARERMERGTWEGEERRFAGGRDGGAGEKGESGEGGGGWFDRLG